MQPGKGPLQGAKSAAIATNYVRRDPTVRDLYGNTEWRGGTGQIYFRARTFPDQTPERDTEEGCGISNEVQKKTKKKDSLIKT